MLLELDCLLEEISFLTLRQIAGEFEERGVDFEQCLSIIHSSVQNLTHDGLHSRQLHDLAAMLKDETKTYAEIRNIIEQIQRNYHHLIQRVISPFEKMREKLGFTESHQILVEIGPGQGKEASKKLAAAGIVTNMNMIPGDKDPLNPSGLRLGTPELTRIGMKEKDMMYVAEFFARTLLKNEDASKIKKDVKAFRKDFQGLHYCFKEGFRGYDYHKLI